jgi:hypothetical protein
MRVLYMERNSQPVPSLTVANQEAAAGEAQEEVVEYTGVSAHFDGTNTPALSGVVPNMSGMHLLWGRLDSHSGLEKGLDRERGQGQYNIHPAPRDTAM